MPTIKSRIEGDLVRAMKSGETLARDTLRMLSAAIKNKEIEKGGRLSDDDLVALLRRESKTREEALVQYRQAGRSEQAAKEEKEKQLIESYLPAQMTEEELERIVAEAVKSTGASSIADMGKVMKEVMSKVAGQAEGNKVAESVRKHLS